MKHASLWRRFVWWLTGGPSRLRLARARREAVFGNANQAMELAFGIHAAAAVILNLLRVEPVAAKRILLYRELVMSLVAPGGRVRGDADKRKAAQ